VCFGNGGEACRRPRAIQRNNIGFKLLIAEDLDLGSVRARPLTPHNGTHMSLLRLHPHDSVSPLRAVVHYADPLPCRGLVFMDSPGYDPVSATGQVASGANLLCFTTGRGSVFGAKPVLSLKFSTTTQLYHRMRDDIDINCGTILDDAESLSEVASRIY
jgi:hypothetical protein